MQSDFFAGVQQSLTDADFVFTSNLVSLNGSGVDANAFLALAGDSLTVSVVARGLTPDELHIQHIHGLFDDAGRPADSAAPTIFADADLDGYVEVLEGVSAYGDILLALEDQGDGINTDPVADATGEVLFSRSYDITDDTLFFSPVTGTDYASGDIFPLPLREIVIHGLEVPEGVGAGTDGEVDGTGGYKGALPVAAGEIDAASLNDALALLSTLGGGGLADGGSAMADSVGGIALGNAALAAGADAIAIGDEAAASGASTTAVGGESDATGTAATAFGWRSVAEGERAHALGHIAEAKGDFSLAIGEAASAIGDNATAIANAASASGIDALAVGDSASAMGTSTTAVGGESVAGGIAATAFGWRASAEGERAHAFGHLADAEGDFTLAIGEAASASGLRAVAIGDRVSAEAGDVAVGGDGASYTLAGLAGDGGVLFVDADGRLSVGGAPVEIVGSAEPAEGASAPSVELPSPSAVPDPRPQDEDSAPISVGESASAIGIGSVAIGDTASADGRDSLAIGDEAMAAGTSTTAVGGESDAAGTAATAFGWRANAVGERAHALGHIASAEGDFSLAVGEAASAMDENATAIGNAAAALGVDALAVGDSATSMGTSTTAVGGESVADGTAATAFGWRANAEGERAHALGHLADASGDFTLAVGEAAAATGTNAVAIGSNVSAAENEFALGDGDATILFAGLGADVGTSGWELVGVDAAGRLFVADVDAGLGDGGGGDSISVDALELSEANEVPAVTDGPATGNAEVTLDGPMLTVSGSFSGLSSDILDVSPDGIDPEGNPIDGAHVHLGAADENGPVIRSLDVIDNGDGSGSFSGSFTLTDDEIDAAEAGNLYINLHTADNPVGELRVQIPALVADGDDGASDMEESTAAGTLAAFATTPGGGLIDGDGASATDIGTIALGNGASAAGVDGIAIGDNAVSDGTSTTAVGGEATASGIAATAFGWRSVALGERAHALGHIAAAVGDFTLAVGEAAAANSDNATAIGNAASATGVDALGLGDSASSQGTSTTAVGGESAAMGIAATAFGWRASAEGERAHALGHLATASGDRSLAIGEAAVATGARAIAIGSNVMATGDDEVALGNADHGYVFAGLGNTVDGGSEAVAVDGAGRLLSVDIVAGGGDGGDGADLILGTAGSDTIEAGAGDDKVIGSAGDDVIDFGDGTDTMEYAASRDAVQPMQLSDGTVTISAPGTGTDTLTAVERIALDDGAFVYDLGGPDAAFSYRLYSAAFARTPDEDGLRFWNDVFSATGDADLIANAFINSTEFAAAYGTDLSNGAYVDALYTNVFGRDADPSGQEFWIDALDSGNQDRADVLLFFVDSDENLALTAPDTEDGFFVV